MITDTAPSRTITPPPTPTNLRIPSSLELHGVVHFREIAQKGLIGFGVSVSLQTARHQEFCGLAEVAIVSLIELKRADANLARRSLTDRKRDSKRSIAHALVRRYQAGLM
jgi:hypothetical protein